MQSEMEREGLTRAEAQHLLRKDDEERRKWSEHLYGIDPWEPSLYDLVIHIHKLGVDDAVDLICHAAALEDFQPTPESRMALQDAALAAEVKAMLMGIDHTVKVKADNGRVLVRAEAMPSQQQFLAVKIEEHARTIPGLENIEIDVEPVVPFSE